ncbi:hypothetical protein [Chromobacterium violaceum]|uniref:hypothetical protein n=1 Tax=Chromobacterium violaceum TaxID=536 RepID=UPI00105680D6|nr:hypothetical protein [Chromobacterium violaceum]
MKKISIFLIIFATLLSTPSRAVEGEKPEASDSKDKYACARSFVAGETTSSFVINCLGKPRFESHKPDGLYVYLYGKGETTFALLFGADEKLIRINMYKQN